MPLVAQPHTVYWVDTCSFLELRRSYPQQLFEPVWTFVGLLLDARRILSIEDVFLELKGQDDEVAAWITRWEGNFVSLELPIQERAKDILRRHPRLIDLKRGKSSADPFLLAACSVNGGVIVTEEKRSGGPQKVKIPDVASELKIECLALLQMLRKEGFSVSGR